MTTGPIDRLKKLRDALNAIDIDRGILADCDADETAEAIEVAGRITTATKDVLRELRILEDTGVLEEVGAFMSAVYGG